MADGAKMIEATRALERIKKGETISPEDAEVIRVATGKTVPPDKITGTVEALKTAYERAGAEFRDVSSTAGGKAASDKARAKLDEARKAMLAKADDEYSRGSIAPDRVEYLGKILGYDAADIAKRAGKDAPKAPAPFTTPPPTRLTPADAMMPAPVAGGAAPAGPVAPSAPAPGPIAGPIAGPAAPASGVRPQPMAAPMPSKAGPVQGAGPSGPGVPIGVSAPPPSLPPPPMGAAPEKEGAQAGGESPPEARAFWDYLQKIQGKGDLVAENPMYTKAFDDATPDEKARLIKENPKYFEKFRGEMDLGTAGTKYADKDIPENTGGRVKAPGGAAAGGGGPLDPKPEVPIIEKAGGVPDWLMRLGEVLQAGAAGAAGITDLDKTAYGRRVSKEAETAKKKEENAFYEKMKALEFDYSTRAAADAAAREADLAKWQTERAAALQREGWGVEAAMAKASEEAANWRTKYSTDASAKAAKEAAAGPVRSLAEIAPTYGEGY